MYETYLKISKIHWFNNRDKAAAENKIEREKANIIADAIFHNFVLQLIKM